MQRCMCEERRGRGYSMRWPENEIAGQNHFAPKKEPAVAAWAGLGEGAAPNWNAPMAAGAATAPNAKGDAAPLTAPPNAPKGLAGVDEAEGPALGVRALGGTAALELAAKKLLVVGGAAAGA